MTAPWNGLPQNPERSGYHWLLRPEGGEPIIAKWHVVAQNWSADEWAGLHPARSIASWLTYGKPVPPYADPTSVSPEGVTDEVVEVGCRALCADLGIDPDQQVPYGDPVNPSVYFAWEDHARTVKAILEAAWPRPEGASGDVKRLDDEGLLSAAYFVAGGVMCHLETGTEVLSSDLEKWKAQLMGPIQALSDRGINDRVRVAASDFHPTAAPGTEGASHD